MSYRIEDKKAAIKEIQKYLKLIYGEKYKRQENGVFNEETKRMIMELQEEWGLVRCGIVDRKTLKCIYDRYIEKKTQNNQSLHPFTRSSFPILPGYISENMRFINNVLIVIAENYRFHHSLRRGMYYTIFTSEIVKLLRESWNMQIKDEIDLIFYQRMMKEYSIIIDR